MSHLITKPTKWLVRPAKTRISLGIRPVWSVFTVRMKKLPIEHRAKTQISLGIRLWSDRVDARADLSLRWAHMAFCWFCHEAAHFTLESYVLEDTDVGFLWWYMLKIKTRVPGENHRHLTGNPRPSAGPLFWPSIYYWPYHCFPFIIFFLPWWSKVPMFCFIHAIIVKACLSSCCHRCALRRV